MTDKADEIKNIEHYQTSGSIRYLTLIQLDGKRLALSYSLLPVFTFTPDGPDNRNVITMVFPSHTIQLRGYRLEKLWEGLTSETVKTIRCVEERYFQIAGNTESVVVNIEGMG